MNYKKAYLTLFNEVSYIIETLKQSQIMAEEIVIGETNESLMDNPKQKDE